MTKIESYAQWVDAGRPPIVCATAFDPRARRELIAELAAFGVRFASYLTRTNWVSTDAVLGEGSVVYDPGMIMPRSQLGRFVLVHPEVAIGHDVVLGDFVSVGQAACISGYVTIGEGSIVGAGAVIVNGRADKPLKIGCEVRIAENAVVTKGVRDGMHVAGNPARLVR